MARMRENLLWGMIKGVIIGNLMVSTGGVLLVGCSGTPNSNSAVQFTAGNTNTITANQIPDQLRQLTNPSNRALYEQARATSLSDIFNNALNLVPTTPVVLGGYTFNDPHDLLAEHATDLQAFSDTYGTVGSFMDAMGIDSSSDLTPEDMQASFALLDAVINRGAGGASKEDTSSNSSVKAISTTSAPGLPSANGLALAFNWGCLGSALGAMGATVGAGVVCAGTGGLACAGGALGAAAALANAGNACKGIFKKSGATAATPTLTPAPVAVSTSSSTSSSTIITPAPVVVHPDGTLSVPNGATVTVTTPATGS